jgi:hypothetical protein
MKVLLSDIVRKPHDASTTSGADGVMRIEHAITDDLPDGRPTLPFGDDDSPWTRLAALPNGRTHWRRIHLQPNTALPIGVADDREPFQTPYTER